MQNGTDRRIEVGKTDDHLVTIIIRDWRLPDRDSVAADESFVIGALQRIESRWLDSPGVVVESDVDVSTESPWLFTVMVRQLDVAIALTP
jgi:hypothetical protein